MNKLFVGLHIFFVIACVFAIHFVVAYESYDTYEEITIIEVNDVVEMHNSFSTSGSDSAEKEVKEDLEEETYEENLVQTIIQDIEENTYEDMQANEQESIQEELVLQKESPNVVVASWGASVSFSSGTILLSEEWELVLFDNFTPPQELSSDDVEKINKQIDGVEVKQTFKIGGKQRINVLSGAKEATATISLPTKERFFNNKAIIYSSQTTDEWEYHAHVDVQSGGIIAFETTHFTYFLLWSELGTMHINNADSVTTWYNVILSNNVSGATMMKFANDFLDLDTTPWETFTPTKSWSLTGDNGAKRVHAIYQDANGVTGYVFDDILLNAPSQATGISSMTWIVAWFDATDTATIIRNASNQVSQWLDKSGAWNHLLQPAQPSRPIYLATWLNNQWAVSFDGTTWIAGNTSFPKPYTIVTASQADPSSTAWCLICSVESFWILGYWATMEDVFYAAFGRVASPWVPLTSTTKIYSAAWYNITTEFYKNGSLLQIDTANREALRTLQLGRAATSAGFAKSGKVSEILIFDRQLSTGELNDVHCYFGDKWGVQVTNTCDTSVAPVLSNPGNIPPITTNPFVSFSFDSTKEWIVSLSWNCTSGSILHNAVATGTNLISFGPLPNGIYNNCTITVTDNVAQQSNVLTLPSFTMDTTLTWSAVTPLSFSWLQLWLDASDTGTLQALGNNRITQWNDKSWKDNHVVATAASRRPLLLPWWQNWLDTVQFQWDDSLNTTGSTIIGANTDFTKFLVMKLDNSNTTNCTFWNLGGHTIYFGNTDRARMHNQGQVMQSTIGIGTSQYALIVMTYDPSVQNSIYVNGTNAGTNTTSINYHDNGPTYIWSWGNSCPLQGRIAEIGVYNQGLTDAERQDLECHLADKWNLPISLPCASKVPPVLSNPSAIASPITTGNAFFSFVSDSPGMIEMYGSCAWLLDAPANRMASSGVNNIAIGPLQNGMYNDCRVAVRTSANVLSNVLSMPWFSVVDITGSAPVVWSGAPWNLLMHAEAASASFFTDATWYIQTYGDCAISSFDPQIAVTWLNVINFAYLETGNYDTCRISVTTLSWVISNIEPISWFTIVDTDLLFIGAPTSLYLPSVQPLPAVQHLTHHIADDFYVCDNAGFDQWWYTTVQVSALSWNYATLPSSTVSMMATWVSLMTWQHNANVELDASMSWWQSLDVPRVFIKRDTWINYSRKWCYTTNPSLKVEVPTFAIVDQYSARITYTLYE